ncbi:hypothetical protein KSB_26300 [Ktedonobacter robiniae]|uniref:Four helix bundle protein n=1 Tax=Ktedonobacter robiniae TaxID=2778365 RepID=A0ABQ3UN56_9CHLR|nr:hypothetical protein KSB_26300 [Ktedonobacter robiniae]
MWHERIPCHMPFPPTPERRRRESRSEEDLTQCIWRITMRSANRLRRKNSYANSFIAYVSISRLANAAYRAERHLFIEEINSRSSKEF